MSAYAAAFFGPGQGPPPFALPPQDKELQKRIDTLTAYAARNGPQFIQTMVERQGSNPEFAFLHGGEGAPYYSWALYCSLHGLPVAQPPPGQAVPAAAQPHQAAPSAAATQPQQQPQPQAQQRQQEGGPGAAQSQQDGAAVLQSLPGEVSSGWQQVLGLLTGSRDSIRNSQQWFMACAPYAAGMAEMMLQQVMTLEDYQKQLHVVYLANDILFKALSTRQPGTGPEADPIAQAFRPRLGRMLRRTFVSSGESPEVQQNLVRVVNFWAERGVFDHLVVEQLTMDLMGITLPAGPAGAAGTAGEALPPAAEEAGQQAQQGQMQGHGQAAATAAGLGGGQQQQQQSHRQWGPPSDAAAAAPAVQQQQQQQQQWGQPPLPQPHQQQHPGQYPAGTAGEPGGYFPPGGAPPPYSQHPGAGAPPYGQHPAAAAAGAQQGYPGAQPPLPGASHPGAYGAQAPYGGPAPQGYAAQQGMQAPYPHPQPQPHHPNPHDAPPPYGAPPGGYGGPPPPHGHPQHYPGHPGHPAGQYPGGPPPPDAYYPPPPGPGPDAAGYYPPPPGAAPGPGPGPGPAAGLPPPEPEPEPEPQGFDAMSFPPGLIPKLVEEKLKTDPPYSPLSILDIERTGVPPPPKMDAYLKSRVDKFMAQLADYRPGMLYSDIEVEAPRHKHFSDRGGPSGPGPSGPLPPLMPEAPPRAGLGAVPYVDPMAALEDGSFGMPGLGGAGRGGTGLGFNSARQQREREREREREQRQREDQQQQQQQHEEGPPSVAQQAAAAGIPENVFSSYRFMRSKGYHQMIINNAARKFGK